MGERGRAGTEEVGSGGPGDWKRGTRTDHQVRVSPLPRLPGSGSLHLRVPFPSLPPVHCFATDKMRSITFGSSGSNPDFGKRGVRVAQLGSI